MNGIIRQGPRAGTYSVWARPGLMKLYTSRPTR
jgi:hypothetical protein